MVFLELVYTPPIRTAEIVASSMEIPGPPSCWQLSSTSKVPPSVTWEVTAVMETASRPASVKLWETVVVRPRD
jgi:hypothetical protein